MLGVNAYVRVTNFGKVVVESSKGDLVCHDMWDSRAD
jgi:hypothetical protein